MMNSFQTAERTAVLLALLAAALVFSIGSALSQTETIWSENFTDDAGLAAVSGSGGITLDGDQWSASAVTAISSTLGVSSGAFIWTTDNTGNGSVNYTCTWVSDPIDATGFSSLYLESGYSSGDGTVTSNIDESNISNVVVTLTITMKKNQSHALDNIVLAGTCTPTTWYADTDGDGLGDAESTTSACSQPEGYVSDSSDLCDDLSACNYDAGAYANAACLSNDACGVCGGSGVDSDSDGICDDVDLCYNLEACNYSANPTAVCSFDQQTWYEDADGDGLGDPAVSQVACAQPEGFVLDNSDPEPDLNPDDYHGTPLYPGDVYMSYAAEEFSNYGISESYVGFTLLRSVVEGTELILSPSLRWDGDSWVSGTQTTVYKWTAPAGGVQEGTEVILFNILDFGNANVNAGQAFCDAEGNRVRVLENDGTRLTGGQACGTWSSMGTTNDYFTWNTRASWIFQPDKNWDPANANLGTPGYDGKCRALSCVGVDLDWSEDGDGNTVNTGLGTLITGNSEVGSFDVDFAIQLTEIVNSSQWAYSGGNELIPFSNNSNVLTPRTLKELVAFTDAGVDNSYASTKAVDGTSAELAPAYDALDFDPNGSISIPDSLTWSQLFSSIGVAESGSESLDFVIDNGYICSMDVAPEGGGGVNFGSVTVNAGSFIGCDGVGRSLGLSGNLTLGETGTFVGGRGQVRLKGASAQTIDANNYADASSTKLRLNSLKVEQNKTASIKGHVRMRPGGHLEFDPTATSDQLALDGTVSSTLTFESDATGTAAIASCAASNFGEGANQQFTFQRYIPADPNGTSWVNIGAYVTGTTVADWTAANPGMLIFKYNEPNYGSQSAGWSYLWNSSTELLPGSGYMAMIPQNQDALISVTGAFQIGDVPITLTFTDDPNQSNATVDGWNLVSNPYPAPVNMQQVLAGTGISTWYVFDNETADAYIAGGSDAPNVLDVGQSMWIKVDAETVITFSEEDKVTDTDGTFVREFTEDYAGTVGLQVSNTSDNLARAFVKFQANTTAAFDTEHDALMYNSTGTADLGVWMVAETGEKLSRQAAGLIGEVSSIPLKVNSGSGGLTEFYAFNHPETPDYTCVVIEDTETGERAQLGVDTLSVDLPSNTHFADRFVLHFTPAPAMTWQSTACDGLEVEFTGEAWETWEATWSSNDGSASGEGLPYELADGNYTFEFELAEAGCTQSVSVTVETACLGDFNLNGERDIVDLLVILAGLPGGTLASDFAEEADCDCDGAVTVNDMLTFLTVFASPCE